MQPLRCYSALLRIPFLTKQCFLKCQIPLIYCFRLGNQVQQNGKVFFFSYFFPSHLRHCRLVECYTVPCLESEFSSDKQHETVKCLFSFAYCKALLLHFITPRHLLETISGLAFFCYWITVGKYKCSHVLITLPEANVRYPKNEYKGNFYVVRNKITVQLIGTTVNKMVKQLYEFIFQKYLSGLALKDQPTHSHTYRMHRIHVYLCTMYFSHFFFHFYCG